MAVDISGWSLSTTAGRTVTVTIPSGTTIGPNGYYIVAASGQWLDNEGESVILFDASGTVIDATPVLNDTANDDKSWQRAPDGQDN